jgi:hypothetical protein
MYSFVGGYWCIGEHPASIIRAYNPEDGGNMLHQNIGIGPQNYTPS